MQLSDFDYDLPEELIATEPVSPRDHSRLLVINRNDGSVTHRHFYDLPDLLSAGDLLVLNNTKVFPARLFAKGNNEREFEIVLLERISHSTWKCLVRPGKKIKEPTAVLFSDGTSATVSRKADTSFEIEFSKEVSDTFFSWISNVGLMPLPPYIKRKATQKDKASYQTVFAEREGSIAAPTAGLHFTESLLQKIKDRGIQVQEVTLHVGYGTFSPIQTQNINDHQMHFEQFEIPANLPNLIEETKKKGHRVVGVGTTALRTLESYPAIGLAGRTNIFIKPGYKFQVVDALITNFHIPKSSLFVLICALIGTDKAKEVYRMAVLEKYRFYSYGDANLIL